MDNWKLIPRWLRSTSIVAMIGCALGSILVMLSRRTDHGAMITDARLLQVGKIVLYSSIALAIVVALIEIWRNPSQLWSNVPSRDVAIAPMPLPAGGIAWIGVDPKIARAERRIGWYLLTLPILFGLLFWRINSGSDMPTLAYRYMVVLEACAIGVLTISVFGTFVAFVRSSRMRLGIDPANVWCDSGSGSPRSYPTSEVLIGPAQLLIGNKLITLKTNNFRRYRFPESELNGYLISRVPAQNRVSQPKIVWNALRRGNLNLGIAIISVAIVTVLNLGKVPVGEGIAKFVKSLVELIW